MVRNKLSGVVVHGDGKSSKPNLVEWILSKYPEITDVGEAGRGQTGEEIPRPGIVHRLDRETSGVMLIAKTEKSFQNLKEQFVIDLVANCFEKFFDKHICKYKNHKEIKLSCVGSVAFYYSNILRAVAAKKSVNIDNIMETPIAGLTLYHLGEE